MLRLFLCTVYFCLLSSLAANAQNNLLKQLTDLPAPAPIVVKADGKRERPPEFYSHKNIPPDDAPLEDLLDFWTGQVNESNPNQLEYQPKPSEKTVERLLEYLEDKPEEIFNFLETFPPTPENAERIKGIYNKLANDPKNAGNYQSQQVKNWLKFNSREYSGELVKDVRRIKDENDYVQNNHQFALRSLARVDWDAARPFVERLESDSNQPYSQILANWVLYQHAIDANESSDAEKYRERLKKIVEDKGAAWAKRDLAMDALVAGGDWSGRDEWYFSLLDDETLLTIQDNGNTGLTTMVGSMPPEKYREQLIALLKSGNLAARSAAARNLIDIFKDEKEILEALLPWLSDPNWAKESRNKERTSLITNLGVVLVPESVPALIAILSNEEQNRLTVAKALAKYKDSRALPVLKSLLQLELTSDTRNAYIEAIIACGGFSDDEQIIALEAYATMISTPKGLQEVNRFQYESYEDYHGEEEEEEAPRVVAVKPNQKLLPVQISIGKYVAEQTEPSEGLVLRAIERVKVLRRTNPAVAVTLDEIMKKWQGRAIFIEALRQIRSGEANIEVILTALAQRKMLREKIPTDVANLRGASGLARGIGACLAEDESDFLGILGQPDAEAQTAMFGCARLLRVKLPITEVETFLKSPNKLLAIAAERYLESEDSVRARTIILAKYSNEARILGARTAFIPDEKNAFQSEALNLLFQSVNGSYFGSPDFANLNKINDKLRNEIKETPDMLAVYALSPNLESGQQVVRVYKDRVTYTFYEDAARYWERNLTAKEYEAFYNSLLSENIDSLTPFYENCHHGCPSGEFVMFGRGGGRRVYYSAYNPPESLAKLAAFFESFKSGEIKLRYRLADKIKGLEVLLANDKLPVQTVWKKDADLRFVVADLAQQEEFQKSLGQIMENSEQIEDETEEQRAVRFQAYQKRRQESEFAHFSWRKLENGKPDSIVSQPFESQFLYDNLQVAKSSEFSELPRAWKVRTKGGEIRAKNDYETDGLYRVAPGQTPSKLRAGKYLSPMVSADGKWAVVSKAQTEWYEPKTIVRVNLQTGAESKVNIAPSDVFSPMAFLPTQNKFLLYRAKTPRYVRTESGEAEEVQEVSDEEPAEKVKPNPSPKTPEYYLLDANTGIAQIVKGDFRPLEHQTFRPLQPTANPGEFWAAVYDAKLKTTDIGRYNEKTFTFQTVAKLPEIELESMSIWVDEKENKIYFTYQGHLLSVPLK